jgi:hypothetical protein
MPHLIEFHFRNFSRDDRLRQGFAVLPNPTVHLSMVSIQEPTEHAERALRYRVEQHAECLFRRNFVVGAVIAFAKVELATFTFVPLFAKNNAILD